MTTYAEREQSVADSEPIELYKFTRTTGELVEQWLYANSESNVTFNDEVYTGTPGLRRGDIQQNGEDISMQVEVDIPRLCCITDQLKGTTTPTPIHMQIFRVQRGLADSEYASLFNGEIAGCVFEGSICKVTGTSEEAAWSDSLGRLYCQRLCPHMLFDEFCGADPDAVTFQYKITDIDAARITITVESVDDPDDHLGMGATYFIGGVVERFGRRFFISQQAEDVLTLQTPLPEDAAVDDTLKLTAGCNRQTTDCKDVHNNIARYGGFAKMPERSPWSGVS